MSNKINIRTGRHCVFILHAHLVFVCKYRGKIFEKEHMHKLRTIMQKVCSQFDVILEEFNGEADHVHLLINFTPTLQLSKLVNSLKGVSSRLIKKEYPEISKSLKSNSLWSASYFAGSVGGAPLSKLREYIENQGGTVSSPT